MINLTKSLRTLFTKDLATQTLTHEEKLLLVVAQLAQGVVGDYVYVSSAKRAWPKSIFKVVFHNKYITLAKDEGWIDRPTSGVLTLTDSGLEHLTGLFITEEANPLADSTQLIVFTPKQSHDFDQYLRTILSSAKKKILIADSYVDESIFNNLLHVVDTTVKIELMFNHDNGEIFHTTAKRFRLQHAGFSYAKYPKLHDRYLVVDDIAFVIGPSLKDAAVNSPAYVVRIGSDQSTKLISLFDNIYTHQRKITV